MPTKLDDSTRSACLAGITMRASCSVGPFRAALMAPYIQARPPPVDTCNYRLLGVAQPRCSADSEFCGGAKPAANLSTAPIPETRSSLPATTRLNPKQLPSGLLFGQIDTCWQWRRSCCTIRGGTGNHVNFHMSRPKIRVSVFNQKHISQISPSRTNPCKYFE